MEWSGIKIVSAHYVRYDELSDGRIRCDHVRLDPATRRYHHATLYETHRVPAEPYAPCDFIFIGAAVLLARELGLNYELPF